MEFIEYNGFLFYKDVTYHIPYNQEKQEGGTNSNLTVDI